mmetsp:Transcript_26798/g.81101  ORF Transcript_26798/g.81101 Transcript_26798/m.81101 type:complete len:209 (-) Transcript_26798:231-857(-)
MTAGRPLGISCDCRGELGVVAKASSTGNCLEDSRLGELPGCDGLRADDWIISCPRHFVHCFAAIEADVREGFAREIGSGKSAPQELAACGPLRRSRHSGTLLDVRGCKRSFFRRFASRSLDSKASISASSGSSSSGSDVSRRRSSADSLLAEVVNEVLVGCVVLSHRPVCRSMTVLIQRISSSSSLEVSPPASFESAFLSFLSLAASA